jgi:hypothetical protein
LEKKYRWKQKKKRRKQFKKKKRARGNLFGPQLDPAHGPSLFFSEPVHSSPLASLTGGPRLSSRPERPRRTRQALREDLHRPSDSMENLPPRPSHLAHKAPSSPALNHPQNPSYTAARLPRIRATAPPKIRRGRRRFW